MAFSKIRSDCAEVVVVVAVVAVVAAVVVVAVVAAVVVVAVVAVVAFRFAFVSFVDCFGRRGVSSDSAAIFLFPSFPRWLFFFFLNFVAFEQ